MENFVLNLFSDQLAKVILNFNDAKMKINANFMAGKGSITNVKLNVDLINDFLNKPPHGILPYLKLSEVTLTKLRLEVTSYTNLKKAPVVLVIDEIHAHAIEPLEYYFDGKSNPQNQKDPGASPANAPSAASKPQYGLLQRIQDNLSVRVDKINFTFQPLGKFKTRRVGPWTPPPVMVTLKNVEWISVTEMGNVGTPEMIWAHNDLSAQQSRMKRDAAARAIGHQHRTYTIFKRLTMVGCVRLLDANQSPPTAKDGAGQVSRSRSRQYSSHSSLESSMLISDCNIEMHVAYLRRLRDAAITGIDVDILCKDADICLDLSPYHASTDMENSSSRPLGCSLQSLIHFMVGLQHCVYKDRSFVDPLLPENTRYPSGAEKMLKENKRLNLGDVVENETEELGPDDFMPAIHVEDDDLDESSEDGEEPDEEHDEAFLAWKREQGLEVEASVADPIETVLVDAPHGVIRKEGSSHSLRGALQNSDKDNEAPSKYKRKRKAVIVLARGAQKFENLSFSLTLRRVNAKLYLPQKDHVMEEQKSVSSNTSSSYRHCLELLAEGAVIECIWPKPSGEIGGNVQCSLRYLHIMEAVHRLSGLSSDEPKDGSIVKYSALMRMGTKLVHRDVFSLSSHWNSILWRGATEDETLDDDDQGFPLMSSRPVSWKWSRSSNVSGPSAISLKSTVSFVDENLALWSKTKVVHEASIGKIEVCFDSAPLGRLVEVISSVPLNYRWFSGEWSNDITFNMLVEEARNGVFSLKNHIQPLPGWSNAKLSALSSDLRSITARFGGFVMRMPHAVHCFSSCGLAEVVFSVSKATLLVSSELPVSFLTGTITASDGTSKSFPNDERDISCRDDQSGLGSETAAKFRLQVTLSDVSLNIVPMQQLYLSSDESNINSLIAPTKITMMTSLEHAHILPQSESGNGSDVSQSFVVSVLIQRLESNVALQRAISATSTINYHLTAIMRHVQSHSPGDTSDDPLCAKSQLAGEKDDYPTEIVLVVCLHVPELEFNMFDDRTHPKGSLHLSRLILRQVEFGFESTCDVAKNSGDSLTTVCKCVIEGFAFQVISKEYTLIDFVTTGMGTSEVAASANSFLHHDEVKTQSDGNVMIRIWHNSLQREALCSSVAVDISSLAIVSLDIGTIKMFSDFVISALSAPVYFYSRSMRANSFEPIAQSTISALWSSVSKVLALSHSSDAASSETYTAFTRLLLSNLLVQVPSTSLSTSGANFLFSFDAVELAYCYSSPMKEPTDPLLEQKCGRGDDWQTVLGDATDCDTFYLLKSRLSGLIADGDSFMFVFPTFSVDWSSNRGHVQITECIKSFLSVGTILSSATMTLFYLLPRSSSKSNMTSAAKEMHNMIANYHSKVMTILCDLEDKVEKMRVSLFVKERERVGMMALTIPLASGWLRISERSELSFHRLFATATLFRYWAVLSNSLMVFYENPGSPLPTLIFPITASSTSIREISIPGPGIVGTHLQQKGFALIDSATGNELFCVAGSQDEFTMWLSSIACQLRQDTTAINSRGNEAFALDSPSGKHELAGEVANELSSSLRVTDDYVNDPTNISISDKSNQDVIDLRTPQDEALATRNLIEILNEDPLTRSDTNFIPSNDLELDNDEMETIALENMELPYTTSASASRLSDTPPDPIFGPVNMSNSDMKDTMWPSTHGQAEEISPANVQKTLSRDLLKSKFASSKFSSALKTAKGGVIAASEIGRDSLRQALSNDGSALNNTSTNIEANRSVLAGRKLSALKKTANTKIVKLSATVRSSVQEHSTHIMHAQNVVPATSSHVSTLRQDGHGNSTENSGHEAALGTSDLSDISSTSCALNQSSRQDQIRKKLANLDQSMVLTMRRLKIDEKLNNISSVVKNVAESRSVNVSQPRNSDHREHKTIKFDARETFESHSVLPVRMKTIKPGSSMTLHDDFLSVKSMELTKIQGNWIIDVELTSCLMHTSATGTEESNSVLFRNDEHFDSSVEVKSTQASNICSGSKQWTYKITSREIGDGGSAEKVHSVEKSLSDILVLHALISEILSSHYSCAAEVTLHEATQGIDSLNPAFQRMPPLERIKVSGSVLQGILDASKTSIDSDAIRKSHCKLIKVFLYTLITSYLPKFALQVTEEFLDIASISKTSGHKGCLTQTTEFLNDAFSCVCNHADEIKQSPSVQSHSKACGKGSFIFSSLLDTIMGAYSRATQERDEALASLTAASILKDNEIFLKYMAKDLENVTKPTTVMQQNIDDEMQMLCKNLGQEIELRSKAEAEILNLKQQLELEQKLAKVKEDDLMVELDKYKSLLKSMSSRK